MDLKTFDRLTRLFHTARSRRAAWHALLGTVLVGAATGNAAAARPACSDQDCQRRYGAVCCPGKQGCSCDGRCGCRDRCFERAATAEVPRDEVCCRGPEWTICIDEVGNDLCCPKRDDTGHRINHPCDACIVAGSIAGSYRRR
jgi:hypothetical protein